HLAHTLCTPLLSAIFSFFPATSTPEIYTLSLHDALPILAVPCAAQIIHEGVDYWRTPLNGTKFKFPEKDVESLCKAAPDPTWNRSEEHTSELQSLRHLVCRLLLEKKKKKKNNKKKHKNER